MIYKHLVVAVDGSRTSLQALNHAAKLAALSQAEMTLVNIANPSEYMALAPEFLQQESYESAAMSQGNEVLDYAEKIAKEAGVSRLRRRTKSRFIGVRHTRQNRLNALADGQFRRNGNATKHFALADYSWRFGR